MYRMRWRDHAFTELTVAELYAIIALRERVFVVEQACVYLDADGLDPQCRHLWAEDGGAIVAYARIVPPGERFSHVAIGRVIIAPEARGRGLARELMTRALGLTVGTVELAAQAHLEPFYASLGFSRTGEVYVEDGIPHVDMLRNA
jgi:ElaA protein